MELLFIFFQLILVGFLATGLAIVLTMVLVAVLQSQYLKSVIEKATELDMEISSIR